MSKNNVRVMSIILLSLFLVTMCLPIVFNERHYSRYYGIGEYLESPLRYLLPYSDYYEQRFISYSISLLICLSFLSTAGSIIFLSMQFRHRNSKHLKYLSLSPVFSAVTFYGFSALLMIPGKFPYYYRNLHYYWSVNPAWVWYIALLIILGAAVLSCTIAFGKASNEPINKYHSSPAPLSSEKLDDLRKYKELFDAGVISNIEFEEVKNKLLISIKKDCEE